jgi:hypothetical protein
MAAVENASPDIPDDGMLLATLVLVSVLGFMLVVIVAPLSLCKLERLPVAMDQVFEAVHSRALATVEAISLFLLLTIFFFSFVFDVRLCRSSFVLAPVQFVANFAISNTSTVLLPTSFALPHAALQMHDGQQTEKNTLVCLFILRFVFCNLVNSRWRHNTVVACNWTGLVLAIALFLSIWSLPLMMTDLRHCRYPTADADPAGYCVIEGSAFPTGSVPSQQFLRDCALQSRTGWNDSAISFRQILNNVPNPNFPPPSSILDFSEPHVTETSGDDTHELLSYALLTSRAGAFKTEAIAEARLQANAIGVPLPDMSGIDVTSLQNTMPMPCSARSGSVLEGVNEYIAECEGNDEMREATLLVLVLTVLNGIELVILLKIAATNMFQLGAQHGPPCLDRDANRTTGDTFFFPTRLIVAIIVEWLVVIFFFASQIDMTATTVSRSLGEFEAVYTEQIIPQLRGPTAIPEPFSGILPTLAQSEFQNSYFNISTNPPTGGGLPPLAYFPPYHDLDGDCPCSVFDEWYFLGGKLLDLVPLAVLSPGQIQCPDGSDKCGSTFCCDSNGLRYCPIDYVYDTNTKVCVDPAHQAMQLLETRRSGALIKCSVEYLRLIYEPVPFACRWGGVLSLVSAALSTFLFLRRFRAQGIRLRELVDEHFDPESGWPCDRATIPLASDRELLGGTETTDTLPYDHMTKLPMFVGLHVGNFVVAFLVYVIALVLVLYIMFCKALPSIVTTMLAFATPVISEALLRRRLWGRTRIVETQNGIRHPRLFATVDLVLTLTSVITGPIKTLARVIGAQVCIFANLFRSDRCLMVEPSLVLLDQHYRSTQALLTSLRVRYEFIAIERAARQRGTTDGHSTNEDQMEGQD